VQKNVPWSDAWIFVAIVFSRRPNRLGTLIRTADAINHAIPLAAEMNGALDRLCRLGFVSVHEDSFLPTASGQAFYERAARNERTVLGIVNRVHAELQREPLGPGFSNRFTFTDDDIGATI
jgi:hypothetical protein